MAGAGVSVEPRLPHFGRLSVREAGLLGIADCWGFGQRQAPSLVGSRVMRGHAVAKPLLRLKCKDETMAYPSQRRLRDTHILFAVRYQDGRSAYVRVAPAIADDGDYRVIAIAREQQERGEIPDGTITGVKRVR